MRRTPFPAPAAAPVEGEVLAGKYCVERVLGAGGRGIGVAARHVHLNERVHAFSAVKVGGERLYKKARRGELVEAPARPIEVYRADLLSHAGDRAEFLIECSSGTYVRQLIADLGDAYCEELQRTAIGPFRLDDADPERIIPLEQAQGMVPA